MATENLKLFETIAEIVEIQEIELDDNRKALIGEQMLPIAEENAQYINVYRMVYMSQGHKVVGYIVEPKEGDQLPCVVYNRSGTREAGAIKVGRLFLGLSDFARAGYISIFTQYSGNGGSEGADEMGGSDLNDVLVLYQILRKYSRADSSRIGMYGQSRGGLMIYLSLAMADWIKAAVIIAGPTDLVTHKDSRPEMDKRYTEMFGDSIEERKKRSAIYWADKLPKNVPILIMHGTADWRINPLDSLRIAEKLQTENIPYKLVMFDGADHSLSEYKEEASQMTINWFDRFVKNKEPLPNLEPHGK